MIARLILGVAVAMALALPLCAQSTITLLHFSDYHSHALPHYTDDGERGGIARAVGYLKQEKRRGALVFSGGDMVNKGAPAWSDAYGCAEWPWLNGVVDAMAFGNHDADYGPEELARCRGKLRYPILSANTAGFQPSAVFTRDGVRIGVFAVAGPDFPRLVKADGISFTDSVEAARRTVTALRENEHVDAVVMIGHEHAEADYELARAVPGIDLIFGSHSHLLRELTRIPGTDTWFISPSQYLTWISRVELTVHEGAVRKVEGRLVPVDASMREDRVIARRAARMQKKLERNPSYRDLFLPIGELEAPLSTANLAGRTLRLMREATGADAALSTVSSFRSPLPAGTITLELLRGAMPYDNEVVVCSMSGPQLQRILESSESRRGTDSESYVSAPRSIEPDGQYTVATTDYQANVAYRELFDCEKRGTGLRVRELVKKSF